MGVPLFLTIINYRFDAPVFTVLTRPKDGFSESSEIRKSSSD